ncbi:MAG: TRAP transporter large permease subunit [Betaproteobacteria bacterium]|nr:TRAP transporter large permease subunit [Betaproteobacteria bacterium]
MTRAPRFAAGMPGFLYFDANSIGAMPAPPLGVSLFASARIAECDLSLVIRALLPFIAVDIAALAIVSAFPALYLWLPRLAGLL